MSALTLSSGSDPHHREAAFRRSFIVSLVIHAAVIAVAGSMTLFRMSGLTYAPTYTVDLVSLPPAPRTTPEPAAAAPRAPARPAPAEEKTARKQPREVPPPPSVAKEPVRAVQPTGGDEAARLERRRRIQELEQEARRLYESYTTQEAGLGEGTEDVPATRPQPGVTTAVGPSPAGGGGGSPADLRFRAYYDRVWAQIKSSWVLPEGVAADGSLLTVVGIRIATDGTIEQYWIEKKSGNAYYDQSAIRAIRKASPLPPLPKELGDKPLEVGINFRAQR
ncbi:MAG: TonB C-terminal domain-containing protein [bacterium]|nr:MAG: TonB C-terminal domain-containing protein [bacterium]